MSKQNKIKLYTHHFSTFQLEKKSAPKKNGLRRRLFDMLFMVFYRIGLGVLRLGQLLFTTCVLIAGFAYSLPFKIWKSLVHEIKKTAADRMDTLSESSWSQSWGQVRNHFSEQNPKWLTFAATRRNRSGDLLIANGQAAAAKLPFRG